MQESVARTRRHQSIPSDTHLQSNDDDDDGVFCDDDETLLFVEAFGQAHWFLGVKINRYTHNRMMNFDIRQQNGIRNP